MNNKPYWVEWGNTAIKWIAICIVVLIVFFFIVYKTGQVPQSLCFNGICPNFATNTPQISTGNSHQSVPVSTSPPSQNNTQPSVVSSGEFPASIQGPAIIEWYRSDTSSAGIFYILEGESFNWNYRGHYWIFSSNQALQDRYPSHKQEYLDRDANHSERRP